MTLPERIKDLHCVIKNFSENGEMWGHCMRSLEK